MMTFKDKLETEYSTLFTQYYDDLLKTVMILIDSTEFHMAIDLSKKFRACCNQIGHDPRFTGMIKFLDLVRNRDRQMEDLIGRIRRKLEVYKLDAPIVPTSVEKFEAQYMRFYRQVDKLTYDVYQEFEHKEPKGEKSIIKVINRVRDYLKKSSTSDFTAAQLRLIESFRKNETQWTDTQKNKIYRPILTKDDIQIFNDYAKAVENELNDYESRGWYHSTAQFALLFLDYLEKIAKFHQNNPEMVELIRKESLKMKDWLARMNTKYNQTQPLDYEDGYNLNEDFRNLILQYKVDRKAFRIREENKRIISYLEWLEMGANIITKDG